MELLKRVSEGLARKTSRRGLLGRGAEVATGALIGAAAGAVTRPDRVGARHIYNTVCAFPGPGCHCDGCANGVCQKPCIIMTVYYASGCWVVGNVTCCDCDCNGFGGYQICGCGSDYHNDPHNCIKP
jgi:hypothetical protein